MAAVRMHDARLLYARGAYVFEVGLVGPRPMNAVIVQSHHDTSPSLYSCLRYVAYWGGRNHYVFMGDSRIRQVYSAMVTLLSGKPYKAATPHKDDHYR